MFFEVADAIFRHQIIVYSDYIYSVTSLVTMAMVNMIKVKKYDGAKNSCFSFGLPLSTRKQKWHGGHGSCRSIRCMSIKVLDSNLLCLCVAKLPYIIFTFF